MANLKIVLELILERLLVSIIFFEFFRDHLKINFESLS
jgi:hypothetical protein